MTVAIQLHGIPAGDQAQKTAGTTIHHSPLMDPLFIKGNYFFPEVYLSWAEGAVSVLEMDNNDLIAQCGRIRLEIPYAGENLCSRLDDAKRVKIQLGMRGPSETH